jgi:hypothetical protein
VFQDTAALQLPSGGKSTAPACLLHHQWRTGPPRRWSPGQLGPASLHTDSTQKVEGINVGVLLNRLPMKHLRPWKLYF